MSRRHRRSVKGHPRRRGRCRCGADVVLRRRVHTAYVRDGPSPAAPSSTAPPTSRGSRRTPPDSPVHRRRLRRPARPPLPRGRPGSPGTDYGRAKAAAEAVVAGAGALAVRTSLIYGGPVRPPSLHEEIVVDPAAGSTTTSCAARSRSTISPRRSSSCRRRRHRRAPRRRPAGLSRADFAALVAGHAVRRGPAPPGRPRDCRARHRAGPGHADDQAPRSPRGVPTGMRPVVGPITRWSLQ